MRIVLVERSDGDWRTSRQSQWMGEVRQDPNLATRPRHHFDIGEEDYARLLDDGKGGRAGPSLEGALAFLTKHGAVEVVRDPP